MFCFKCRGSGGSRDPERDRKANPSDQGGARGESISTRDLWTTRLTPLPAQSYRLPDLL